MTAYRRQVIAPGRVNLLGEHVDYTGLAVLPMVPDRSVRLNFTPLDKPVVRLASTAPGCDAVEFRLDRPIDRAPQGHWSNYPRAAAWGLLQDEGPPSNSGPDDRDGRTGTGGMLGRAGHLRGFDGRVESDLPIASGLSSSSALVVAVGLALLDSNDLTVPPLDLAARLAWAERFTGVQSGEMDQTACLCGVAGHALRIDFNPLRATPVHMPADWRWIVASSLARAEKSGGAREAYNTRASECHQALQRLIAHASTPKKVAPAYRDLVQAFSVDELLDRAARALNPRLLSRFRHVITEARRVKEAQRAMAEARMDEFGTLMVESHDSLRDDYGVSTPALNEIVSIALDAGAAGAKLTGAGFGGCAVALCSAHTAPTVMEALKARFYAKHQQDRTPGDPSARPSPLHETIFAAQPSAGAQVRDMPQATELPSPAGDAGPDPHWAD